MEAINTIKGVVGSIMVEHTGSKIKIHIRYNTKEECQIETNRDQVERFWIPALSGKNYVIHNLDNGGMGIEIIKSEDILYIQPMGVALDPVKPQAIFSKSSVETLKKVFNLRQE